MRETKLGRVDMGPCSQVGVTSSWSSELGDGEEVDGIQVEPAWLQVISESISPGSLTMMLLPWCSETCVCFISMDGSLRYCSEMVFGGENRLGSNWEINLSDVSGFET
ncbi:hypothetical protein M758_7G030000 [Ceratodon purpureus]|nr:hypothetical protein M758_7G030000 [Ceratodon purpureus]